MEGEGKAVPNPGLDLVKTSSVCRSHRPRWQDLTSCPITVRELVLVPLRLVHDEKNRPLSKRSLGMIWGSGQRSVIETSPNSHRSLTVASGVGRRRLWQQWLRQEDAIAWLACIPMRGCPMAVPDVGEPNGLPVDEWGYPRQRNSQPVGVLCVGAGVVPQTVQQRFCCDQSDRMGCKSIPPPAAAG